MTAGIAGIAAAIDGHAAQHARRTAVIHVDIIQRNAGDTSLIDRLRLALANADRAGVDDNSAAADRRAARADTGAGSRDIHGKVMAIVDNRDALVNDQRAVIGCIGLDNDRIAGGSRRDRSRQAFIGKLSAAALKDRTHGHLRGRGGLGGRSGRLNHSRLGRAFGRLHDRIAGGDRSGGRFKLGLRTHHVRRDTTNRHAFIGCISRRRHEAKAHGDKQQQGRQLRKCFHVVFSFSVHIYKKYKNMGLCRHSAQ